MRIQMTGSIRVCVGRAAGLCVTLCMVLLAHVASASGPGTIGVVSDNLYEVANAANASLNLAASSIFTWQRGDGVASSTVTIPIDGASYTLDLVEDSVRAAGFTVLLQDAVGDYVQIAPPPISTFRGSVVGIEGSAVAASFREDGLYARIIWPDNSTYWIEPIGGSVAGAGPTDHVIYLGDDVWPSGGICGATGEPIVINGAMDPGGVAEGSVAGAELFFAELAVDADSKYAQIYGSAEATVAQIESVINTMNLQYESDIQIKHVITTIIIRTAETDPYTQYDAFELLKEFKAHWRSVHSGIRRDVAQLFTGRDLLNSTIGIAWVGSVCSTFYGYSVVESNCSFCSSLACKTDLSAHELGHNWNAGHECGGLDCNAGCEGWTMNPSLTCSNRFTPECTIPYITAFRNSRLCLDRGDELRRVLLDVPSDTVDEGGTLAFTATADFRFGDDVVITTAADWSTEPPDVGTISSEGVFTAFEVSENRCATVSASFTVNSLTRTNSRTIMVLDTDARLALVSTVPPQGAIDARQPSDWDGSNPTGWQALDLTFNGEMCLTLATDFEVFQEGGIDTAPVIAGFERIDAHTFRFHLSRLIEPGAWTTLTHTPTGESLSIGYLPADSNADGSAAASDILALIDNLNGQTDSPFPVWQCDADRSGACGPSDILRVIDLLNGAGAFEIWNGRSLP